MKIFFTIEDNGNIGGSISFHVDNNFAEVNKYKGPTTICSYWFHFRKQSFNIFTRREVLQRI